MKSEFDNPELIAESFVKNDFLLERPAEWRAFHQLDESCNHRCMHGGCITYDQLPFAAVAAPAEAASDDHQQNEENQDRTNVVISTTNATGH